METYLRTKSYKETQKEFEKAYGITTLHENTIRKLMKKWDLTASVSNRKYVRKSTVLTREKKQQIKDVIEKSPTKPLRKLASQTKVSYSSARNMLKML